MIGRKIYKLKKFPLNIFYYLFGTSDIHMRQKWQIVWPYLKKEKQHSLELLDAGCHTGAWSLEIALRKKHWNITGIDINKKSIKTAILNSEKLNAPNCRFIESDFLRHNKSSHYDIIISVLSIHYLGKQGRGNEIINKFKSWLKKGGKMILLVPREQKFIPQVNNLPQLEWYDIFSHNNIQGHCVNAGLTIEKIVPVVSKTGTLSKQIDLWAKQKSRFLKIITFPLCMFLATFIKVPPNNKSLMWLVIAKN